MKEKTNQIAQLSGSKYTLNGIQYDDASAMVNSFLLSKGSYDNNSHTCIWFSKAAFTLMNSILNNVVGSDGIRLYFAKTIPDGNYTVVITLTLDGGVDPSDETKIRHIHNDFFLDTNPNVPGINLHGKLGEITPQQGALLYSPTSPCTLDTDTCSDAPHYITCSKAYNMVNNMSGEEINATSEWFDKGIIDSLCKLIPTNGGIRVYFARQLDKIFPDTVTRHEFVVILTEPTQISANKIIQQDTYQCISLKNLYYPVKHYPLDGGGTDNGELCPTHCQGTSLPKP